MAEDIVENNHAGSACGLKSRFVRHEDSATVTASRSRESECGVPVVQIAHDGGCRASPLDISCKRNQRIGVSAQNICSIGEQRMCRRDNGRRGVVDDAPALARISIENAGILHTQVPGHEIHAVVACSRTLIGIAQGRISTENQITTIKVVGFDGIDFCARGKTNAPIAAVKEPDDVVLLKVGKRDGRLRGARGNVDVVACVLCDRPLRVVRLIARLQVVEKNFRNGALSPSADLRRQRVARCVLRDDHPHHDEREGGEQAGEDTGDTHKISGAESADAERALRARKNRRIDGRAVAVADTLVHKRIALACIHGLRDPHPLQVVHRCQRRSADIGAIGIEAGEVSVPAAAAQTLAIGAGGTIGADKDDRGQRRVAAADIFIDKVGIFAGIGAGLPS